MSSTPIEMLNHKRCCRVKRDGVGGVIVKVGTQGSESVRVTRGRVEEGKTISFTRLTGEKLTGRVWKINEAAVFIEL